MIYGAEPFAPSKEIVGKGGEMLRSFMAKYGEIE
jgi:hypothetical protein